MVPLGSALYSPSGSTKTPPRGNLQRKMGKNVNSMELIHGRQPSLEMVHPARQWTGSGPCSRGASGQWAGVLRSQD